MPQEEFDAEAEEAFAASFAAQEEAPAGKPVSGVSPLAVSAIKEWGVQKNRPKEWQGRVYGLVVHTSSGDAPKGAKREGISPTEWAVRHYKGESRGCHYVNGWGGIAGGDLVQIANERFKAWGVGVTHKDDPSKDQWHSIKLGRFEKDLPPILVRLWRKRWPNYKHSLEFLPPHTRSANDCYVHVECPPCVYDRDKGPGLVTGARPLRPGLRFTKAQHDAVAHLAVDIARRNGWPMHEAWWRTPRLLGHEDLTPISRHDKGGGWDPGYLREKPYFDWDYVYEIIEQILQRGVGRPRSSARSW
jgi:hypothetical protein